MTMSSKAWWGTAAVPATAVGVLAVTLALSGGNDRVAAPQTPADRAGEPQNPTSTQTLVATGAAPAPARPAVSVSDANATPRVDPGSQRQSLTTSPEMLKRAQALREADRAASRGQGPAEACLAQMKMVICPIIGNMPFVRDVAGQVAMWGNFDCPTGAPPRG